MKGRKPKPTVLKILQANPGKRALNPLEPKPDALSDVCPQVLQDPEERAEWERAIVPAIRIGQITVQDRAQAIAHCQYWALYLKQWAQAGEQPEVVEAGVHHYPRQSACRRAADDTLKRLLEMDEKMGFTATSRSRVQVKGAPSTAAVDRQRKKFFGVSGG